MVRAGLMYHMLVRGTDQQEIPLHPHCVQWKVAQIPLLQVTATARDGK